MTTKQQEREALAKIQKIIAGLGEDSYIGTALEGCLEIAEQNIENDWACSMKQKVDSAENQILVLQVDRDAWKATAQDLQNAVKKLTAELEQAEQTKGENTMKARVTKRNDPSTIFEYDNVVSITDYTAKDMGYCKRILLDSGIAIDFWASDWKVCKLDWVEA